MALISELPNANPQKSDLMEIQNGQTSSNNSTVGQLMQLSASENLAPAYDANAGVYVVGDFVSYNGTLYQCSTAIATPEAFDATKWTAVKVTEITSGASVIQLTQAEYTVLSTAEKMNGSIYKLTDKAVMLCLDEEYHAVLEITSADYVLLTSDEKNNGTLYILTDEETTAADIPYSSGVSVADKLDTIGSMYSSTWTAASSAGNTRLTNSCTLGEKGVYLISIILPNSSASIAFGFRVEGWSIVQKYGQQNSLGAMTFPFEVPYDNLQIYIDSQQSAPVTFSNLERGGLYAVKIK